MEHKIPILMYHMVSETDDNWEKRYCCTPDNFRRQMQFLKLSGYKAITLNQFFDYIEGKNNISSKPIILSFDDGFMDNYINAFPVLKRYGFTAIIFIVSNVVGLTNKWVEEMGRPRRNLLNWTQILEMVSAGIDIGAHTLNHLPLTEVSEKVMMKEIRDSKEMLEMNLGKPVDFLAYPYGKYNESIKNCVKNAGYKAACSTRSGFNHIDVDKYSLRRIEIYGTDSLIDFILKISFGTNQMGFKELIYYYLSRLRARFG